MTTVLRLRRLERDLSDLQRIAEHLRNEDLSDAAEYVSQAHLAVMAHIELLEQRGQQPAPRVTA